MRDATRKAVLTKIGYYVEDLGANWGDEHTGSYRWVNDLNDTFQDTQESYRVEDAWQKAHEDAVAEGN